MLRSVSIATAAAALVAAIITYAPLKVPNPIVINDDGGGNVGDYLKFVAYIRDAHVQVKVDGSCISACTLLLALPPSGICATRRAQFGFHLASLDNIPDPEVTAKLNKRFYPMNVQHWIEVHGPLTADVIYLSALDAIELGIIRECR